MCNRVSGRYYSTVVKWLVMKRCSTAVRVHIPGKIQVDMSLYHHNYNVWSVLGFENITFESVLAQGRTAGVPVGVRSRRQNTRSTPLVLVSPPNK